MRFLIHIYIFILLYYMILYIGFTYSSFFHVCVFIHLFYYFRLICEYLYLYTCILLLFTGYTVTFCALSMLLSTPRLRSIKSIYSMYACISVLVYVLIYLFFNDQRPTSLDSKQHTIFQLCYMLLHLLSIIS